ncbi:hypothetical protein [Mycolicibacter senuensis]|nr:hypothetical protein [Mycolicibacter senuensis]
MNATIRPYATAGVAIVGAGLIAAAPVVARCPSSARCATWR